MPRQAYVNGRYLPHREAAVHIEDRGYQFADGVYEVVPVYNGILVDEGLHLDRLERSMHAEQLEQRIHGDLAEALGEGQLLIVLELLVAQEEHVVRHQGVVQLVEALRRQLAAEVDTAHLGAQCAREHP